MTMLNGLIRIAALVAFVALLGFAVEAPEGANAPAFWRQQGASPAAQAMVGARGSAPDGALVAAR